jgi:hypothetical protein
MRPMRWIVVFCFYLAAELLSPVAAAPIQMVDGEAEESVQLAGQRRLARPVAERGSPAGAEVVAASRSAAPRSAPNLGRPRVNPVRKVPAPVPESSPAPEAH